MRITDKLIKAFENFNDELNAFGEETGEIFETLYEDAKEWLSFWRANLRRAKRYWATDAETLDKIQDGEIEDTTDSEEA